MISSCSAAVSALSGGARGARCAARSILPEMSHISLTHSSAVLASIASGLQMFARPVLVGEAIFWFVARLELDLAIGALGSLIEFLTAFALGIEFGTEENRHVGHP